jgi:hypothetical protein
MFFIFGWNKPQVTEYGPVQQEVCKNCKNTDIWQLRKVDLYFSLFFIPVFPHDTQRFYHCPICNQGVSPTREDFENLKAIAESNTACLEGRITEEDRLTLIKETQAKMLARHEAENVKVAEESSKWLAMVSEKSSRELQLILDGKYGEYNPAFILAAQEELAKRARNS